MRFPAAWSRRTLAQRETRNGPCSADFVPYIDSSTPYLLTCCLSPNEEIHVVDGVMVVPLHAYINSTGKNASVFFYYFLDTRKKSDFF